MLKKKVAILLTLTTVLSMTACSMPKQTDKDEPEDDEVEEVDEEEISETQSEIYDTVGKIADALAACDRETLEKKCTEDGLKVLDENMPVIDVDTSSGEPLVDLVEHKLMVRNMIASTITYEIVDGSYKGALFGRSASVDVVFSYKDYESVVNSKDKFLGPGEFNTLLMDVENTVDFTYTLNFKKDGMAYILTNAGVLKEIYEYDDVDLDYFDGLFDMIESGYVTGTGYDAATDAFYDTNSIDFYVKLDGYAKDYVWDYKWAFVREDGWDWDYLKISDEIVDKYPTEISVTYTQDENLPSGHYLFFIYDLQSEEIYGYEFDVYNSAEG